MRTHDDFAGKRPESDFAITLEEWRPAQEDEVKDREAPGGWLRHRCRHHQLPRSPRQGHVGCAGPSLPRRIKTWRLQTRKGSGQDPITTGPGYHLRLGRHLASPPGFRPTEKLSRGPVYAACVPGIAVHPAPFLRGRGVVPDQAPERMRLAFLLALLAPSRPINIRTARAASTGGCGWPASRGQPMAGRGLPGPGHQHLHLAVEGNVPP